MFKVIRVFEIADCDNTVFTQIIKIDDLYSDEFKQELEDKHLDWVEYHD